jgi:hypothetical protein
MEWQLWENREEGGRGIEVDVDVDVTRRGIKKATRAIRGPSCKATTNKAASTWMKAGKMDDQLKVGADGPYCYGCQRGFGQQERENRPLDCL